MIFLTTLGPVFYKLVYMSLTGLAAGAIMLLLRRLADKRFSPFWKYAMWLLVLAALVIPWRPQSRAAVLSPAEAVQDISFREEYNRAQAEYSAVLAQAPQLPQATPEIEAARREATSLRVKSLAFDELLPLLWLCGAAGTAAFMGIAALRLRRRIRRSEISCDMRRYEALLDNCMKQLGIKRHVRIILQAHVGTPALLGSLCPTILLPGYAAEMSDARLEYVILHELSHLRRRDLIVNALLLALQAVYWYNPLVWVLFKFVREDMELANDAAVLKSLGHEARKEYSLSLVEVFMGCTAQKPKYAMLCMTDGKKNIERRIGMIQLGDFFKKRKWVIAIAGVLVIAGIAALFLTQGVSSSESWELPETYRPLLEGIHRLALTTREEGDPSWLEEPGMEYLISQNLSDIGYNAEGGLGYAVEDINSDGTPELLWLGKMHEGAENPGEIVLVALFTLKDGAPVRLFSREHRVPGILAQDGTLYCVTGTAMETNLTSYKLEPGAAELTQLTEYNKSTEEIDAAFIKLRDEYTKPPRPMKFTFIPIEEIAERVFEPIEFGHSDDPAMIALGKAVDNGLLLPLRIPNGWRLLASDESISLDLMNDGDIWHLSAAMQMEPFFTAGLNEIWWNSGGFAFDKMRASASSFARPYSIDGLCLLSSDWWSDANVDYPPSALFSSLTDQINPENVAFKPLEDWYEIGLDVYNDNRSGKPRMRFANDGSALEFVMDTGFYIEGRLKPAKLQGWEYDTVADTLIKRFAATGNQTKTPPLTPTFLSPEQGREALKPLIWGSDGWWLDAQGDYIFAHFYRYTLRYDVKTNKIDKIIDLGDAPQSWWYSSTYSPDGQSCVAQAQEFDGPGHTGKMLIDLKKETSKPTEQEHFFHSTQTSPYQVEARLMEHGYGWFINDVEIKALRPYAGTITEVIAMDGNRVGALLPVSDDANGYLGYYKFAVIDLAQDKIVQECPMNVLDKGEQYPTYPAEPEPEPLLIGYHLQSVTVLRARFPADGRSSYDGFGVIKVVDAPADVASFEECLKRGAWEPVDEGSWLKFEPSSPQNDTPILYMLGEDGRGLIAHLFSGPEQELPQGGAVSLVMCDTMPTPPEKYRDAIGYNEFERYWVSIDTYKILYGLTV